MTLCIRYTEKFKLCPTQLYVVTVLVYCLALLFTKAFKNHQLVDVFSNVGDADLTADVDFRYLKEAAESCNVCTAGPISQQKFLKNMGIDLRLMVSALCVCVCSHTLLSLVYRVSIKSCTHFKM